MPPDRVSVFALAVVAFGAGLFIGIQAGIFLVSC
jgi:hypothetical protein